MAHSNGLPALRDRRVTVMGLGRFGGGVGVVQFLLERGARVTLTDLCSEFELADSLAQIDETRLAGLHLGGHRERDFIETDLVVANPAVRPDNSSLQAARQVGIPVTSEINLFWQANRAPVIGVTGSNGKSTTAAMIDSILRATGRRSWLGGNIGRSLLPVVEEIAPDDRVVLELSSFQLESLAALRASPHIAVITNFSPNHLDWHGSIDAYRAAKQSILKWQTLQDVAVLNQDDEDVAIWPTCSKSLWFGSSDLGREGLFVDGDNIVIRREGNETSIRRDEWPAPPGDHNLTNTLAAACAALAAGADLPSIRCGLAEFEPLPHRLQFVAEVGGRRFYNDSLATTPESAIAALHAFNAPIVLLAGGYDKHVDLSAFATAIAENVKAVALMGQTADHLAAKIAVAGDSREIAIARCDSLEAALAWADAQAAAGDIVLLSPGCASYDWFRNFAERGERFMDLVRSKRAA